MTDEEIFNHCKLLLRQQNTSAFDEEIKILITACKYDLEISGVKEIKDELIVRTIGIYVKAHFGSENPDREGLIQCYNSLKTHLSISNKYGEVLDEERH